MRKKYILFVMDGMKIGGVENALILVLDRFDYDNYEVDLLLLHEDLELLDKIHPNVKVYHYEQNRKVPVTISFIVWYFLFTMGRVLRLDKIKSIFSVRMQHCGMRNRCNCILPRRYDCAIAYKQGEAENCVAYCISAGRKIAFYHHGSIIDDKLHQKTYARYNKIVAVSNGVEEMLRMRYPRYAEKVITIQNYVDFDGVVRRAKEYCPDIKSDRKIICSVGRLCEDKRFDRAIEVATLLKKRSFSFIWYIIGDGELRSSLEQMIVDNGLQNCVVLTGSMKNPLPYVKACDVYVQTSDAESYGLAIQEAMNLNKPVVSTKTIGGSYLINNFGGGMLVDQNPYDIADVIESSFKNQNSFGEKEQLDDIDINLDVKWKELLNEQ